LSVAIISGLRRKGIKRGYVGKGEHGPFLGGYDLPYKCQLNSKTKKKYIVTYYELM